MFAGVRARRHGTAVRGTPMRVTVTLVGGSNSPKFEVHVDSNQTVAALRARVAKIKEMTPEKIAPMCVFLLSDAAEGISGQIFGVRNNEIFLMGQSRPLRSVHRGEGWTPETVAEHAIPAMKPHFYPLDRSEDIFSWDPI